ncbi:MAG: autotransporter domain-containing protein [Alphaproteobacteria bacterium]
MINSDGSITKTGQGNLYLWGDNSEYGGKININEGNFYAMFEDTADTINDPLGQRLNFSLSNATLSFADGTTFRPKITATKLATIGKTATTSGEVKLVPYSISSLNVGAYNYNNNYSEFSGWESDFAKVETENGETVVTLKKDLAGIDKMGAAVDAYRKRSTLSLAEREIFDNIYYTGTVPTEISDEFYEEIKVISGGDKITYNEVHKAGIRQFSRQIYSRIQNKNCSTCGIENGFSDEHWWFNIGYNSVNKSSTKQSTGYKYEPTSLAMGYDHDIIPNALNMGVALSYAYGDVKGKGSAIYNTAAIDEYMLSLYGKYKPLRAYVTGSIGGGYITNKSKIKGTSTDVNGKYSTRVGFASAEFGYDLGNACGVIEPFVGAEYAYIYNASYSEKGVGARHFSSVDYTSIELPVGLRVSRNFVAKSYIITPAIELAYSRSMGDVSSKVESYFVGTPETPWVMRGESDNRSSFRSSLNLKINNVNSRFAFNLGYGRDTRSNYKDDQVYLTVRYNF